MPRRRRRAPQSNSQQSPRRRRRRGRRRVPGPGSGIVTNPGSRRSATRRFYQLEREVACADHAVNVMNFSLQDFIGIDGVASLANWYDEFKISRVSMHAVSRNTSAATIPLIASVPDIDAQIPTTFPELLRMAGVKTQPISLDRGAIHLGTVKPTTDLDPTSSGRAFGSPWLSTGSNLAQTQTWYGFVYGVSLPGTTSINVTVSFVLRAEIQFRGFQ